MYTIQQYDHPSHLDEAAQLIQKRGTAVVAGGIWLRLGRRRIARAIDLSHLGLDQIQETADEWTIGSMVSLRTLECHSGFNRSVGDAYREAVSGIVGIQLRNAATVGGSVWSRFGFSDLISFLLLADADLTFQLAGRCSLMDFLSWPRSRRDILTQVHIKKSIAPMAYDSIRLEAADLPVLNGGVADLTDQAQIEKGSYQFRLVLGARPGIATQKIWSISCETMQKWENLDAAVLDRTLNEVFRDVILDWTFGTNLRGSASYRQALGVQLFKRCFLKLRFSEKYLETALEQPVFSDQFVGGKD